MGASGGRRGSAGGRVGVAQDWLIAEAGSERVTLELARLLPAADIYTSFFRPDIFGRAFDPGRVHAWPLQRVLGPTDRFRQLLPLYPVYFSLLDLRRYELVISSSVAFTHAVRTAPSATHISYVHTPIRYAWDLDAYLGGSSWSLSARVGAKTLRPILQRWDRATAGRPDVVIANSTTVQGRIRRVWGRESEVIHPPVDVRDIPISTLDGGFYLVAARMLAYRHLDHAVQACVRLGRDLIVVGDGPERSRLEAMAGPTVRFLGRVDRPTLVNLFQQCHAYLVPGIEDFGIAPVEAMAAGKPVVGLREGGVAETVLDGVTGVLYDEPSAAGLAEAIERLDTLTLNAAVIRQRAEAFDTGVFHARWRALLAQLGVDPSLYAPE